MKALMKVAEEDKKKKDSSFLKRHKNKIIGGTALAVPALGYLYHNKIKMDQRRNRAKTKRSGPMKLLGN